LLNVFCWNRIGIEDHEYPVPDVSDPVNAIGSDTAGIVEKADEALVDEAEANNNLVSRIFIYRDGYTQYWRCKFIFEPYLVGIDLPN